MSSAAAPVRRFTSKSVEAAGAFDRGERTVAPYTFEPAASDSASTDEAVTEFDEFPLDAFIIPEGTERLPAGLAEARSRQRQTANDLAARLESLAGRLRRDGYTALARQTVHGDPLDALIAGILAGYLVEISD